MTFLILAFVLHFYIANNYYLATQKLPHKQPLEHSTQTLDHLSSIITSATLPSLTSYIPQNLSFNFEIYHSQELITDKYFTKYFYILLRISSPETGEKECPTKFKLVFILSILTNCKQIIFSDSIPSILKIFSCPENDIFLRIFESIFEQN